MAARRSAALSPPSLYTAQDVARFCEVDLKTVHHWADRGKVAHFRTEGRHLRFRRNDVVRFLRAHGYPLPEGLVRVKPTVAIAPLDSVPLTVEELAKKLASRFTTQRHGSGLAVIAHVLADQPDAIVLSADDPTIAAFSTVAALKAEIPWVVIALVAPEESFADARAAGSEAVVTPRDTSRLGQELGRALGLSAQAGAPAGGER
jgi:excisionase family DNA binding protein